jgi:C-terminal processing protease CtpA/Prc
VNTVKPGSSAAIADVRSGDVILEIHGVNVEEVRCAFSDRDLHSRVSLDPTHVRLKLLHACDQWHSSRASTTTYQLAL